MGQTFVFDQPAVTEGNLAWQSFVTAQPHDAWLTWGGLVKSTKLPKKTVSWDCAQ